MVLTGRAALVALLGSVVLFAVPDMAALAALNLALLALVALDVTVACPVRRLSVARTGAVRTRLGETAVVRLSVTNPSTRTLRATVRDAWPPSAGAAPRTQRITVSPGDRRVIETTLRPTRRGTRVPDRVTIRSVGPLGLAGRQGYHRAGWSVQVLPAFRSRVHLPAKLSRLRELEGTASALLRGHGTEFDSLREYVVGDDTRSIDWRATARRGDVVVRTWRPERDRRVVLVIDTGRTSAARVGDEPRLDALLDAALLLSALALRAGDRVELLAHDSVLRSSATAARQSTALPRLVEAMTGLEPALVESDARRMVAEVLRRARQRALVVLLTGLDPAPLSEGLLPVLGALTARHLVVLGAVADPELEVLAAGRGDAERVYAAAAAERARAERRRAAGMLRQQGALVVEEEPAALPPALADIYLELKAAGQL
jgi:uncharacterized protein (DUF58 family)